MLSFADIGGVYTLSDLFVSACNTAVATREKKTLGPYVIFFFWRIAYARQKKAVHILFWCTFTQKKMVNFHIMPILSFYMTAELPSMQIYEKVGRQSQTLLPDLALEKVLR